MKIRAKAAIDRARALYHLAQFLEAMIENDMSSETISDAFLTKQDDLLLIKFLLMVVNAGDVNDERWYLLIAHRKNNS